MKDRGRKAFTLLELMVSLVLIVALAAVAAGQLEAGLERSRQATCAGNLRQWGVALQLYAADHDGRLPRRGQGVQRVQIIDRAEDWFNALPPYLGSPPYVDLVRTGRAPREGQKSLFVCPCARQAEAKGGHFLSYGMNMYLSRWDKAEATRLHAVPDPATVVFMADAPGGYASTAPSAAPYSVSARHGQRANVLFLDGRVQAFSADHLGCGRSAITRPDVRWETQETGDAWRPGG
jgi:prepilin-type processing-associated H-X9-DG protein/prepilin-type N-terminal cleavage/methylation domain-containing protein